MTGKQQPNKTPRSRTAAGRDARMAKRGRLPDGSHFVGVWHEGRGQWVLTLTIVDPEAEGGRKMFPVVMKGAFTALEKADDKYREWLKRGKK